MTFTSSPTSALLTDLYELTMAQGYWAQGLAHTQASFYMSFRDNPFGGGYAIACGTQELATYVDQFAFTADDLRYLAGLTTAANTPLFKPEFLEVLASFKPQVTVEAVPEGTLVFPREPLVRVTGSLIACQLIETVLLNIVNFQTLIATKASRVCLAAQGRTVAEFGARRAQGMNGALAASRAAFVGGVQATSNVLAGKLYDIPVVGTHAHSWVQAFPTELDAFRALAADMPDNCSLLVDTYRTKTGVEHSIMVARELEKLGHRLSSIRIDSGDLAELSKMARHMLDEAELPYVKICVSNDLDEYTITSLLQQGAPIDIFGVGTKLTTAYDQAALSGVYKLSDVEVCMDGVCSWRPTVKCSEQLYKQTIPGRAYPLRFVDDDGMFAGDMIIDPAYAQDPADVMVDPLDATLLYHMGGYRRHKLLTTIVDQGRVVENRETLACARARAQAQLECIPNAMKRFLNPHIYPCGIEAGLFALRTKMVQENRLQMEEL